jgi:hypothetical protein
MKSSIKVIKNQRDSDSNVQPSCEAEKTVKQRTREMMNTVKSWIAETERRRRAEEADYRQKFSLGNELEPTALY